MWRSLFLALGVSSCLLGVECLAIEKATLQPKLRSDQVVQPKKEIRPPDWAPWSFMGAGAVIVIYSFTIPRRAKD